ncbi:MAG: PIG-L family deacetylase [Caldilineaceae bacterium]|nr:PIG-L family deacetylase [Caldilineaceae bacterium]
MAIAAHPDDIEFGSVGTIARWVKGGAKVAYVLVTSGDVGIAEPGMTKARATEIREAETIDAAKTVGVEDVTFLREPDGMVVNTLDLRKQLVRQIRRFRPEVVVALDPMVMYTSLGGINHPDHRAVGEATMDAIFPACSQPNLFQELEEEGLFACRVRKVYVSSRGEGDTFVDISSTIDLKIAALKAHASQVGAMEGLEDRIRQFAARNGVGKEMDYAEVFRVLTLQTDEAWAKAQSQPAV